jgi:alternate signal-mediated exported protein
MKRTTKGALAAGAAATLLLGGAGSLAYWTETVTVPGSTLESGHLAITGDTCATAGWTLDGGTPVVGSTRIVPGDQLTKDCEFVIEGEGDHLDNVTLNITSVSWSGSNALTTALGTPSATFSDSNGPLTSPATVDVGETITAEIVVTFPTSVTGSTAEDLQATLNTITVTATQNHT